MPEVRTRIAPSPTGYLHIGTARTALFNYLFAKKHGGKFVLRIEDTDLERSDKKFEEEIFESLDWLGIKADESPVAEGPLGPYRQSERIGTYAQYLKKLLQDGTAFYCPHSEEELETERKRLMAEGQTPTHVCSERDRGAESGIVRFKTPSGETIAFNDLIRGELSFESSQLGDFSLAKDVSIPLYNFAVVVDDFCMQISHVIRGEDHIANTPKQILIANALGFTPPLWAHLPLILAPDRSKLSKRNGATSVRDFRQDGYLPEALVNFMALLGWNPGSDREMFSMEELVEAFDLKRVQRSGAVFNIDKIDWLNGEYIRKKSIQELALLLRPYLPTIDPETLEAIAALEQPRLKKLSEIWERASFFVKTPEYEAALLFWKQMPKEDVARSLEESREIIQSFSGLFSREKLEELFLQRIGDQDKGRMLWPLRVALTGKKASPGPFEVMAVLGKEESLKRLTLAFEKVNTTE